MSRNVHDALSWLCDESLITGIRRMPHIRKTCEKTVQRLLTPEDLTPVAFQLQTRNITTQWGQQKMQANIRKSPRVGPKKWHVSTLQADFFWLKLSGRSDAGHYSDTSDCVSHWMQHSLALIHTSSTQIWKTKPTNSPCGGATGAGIISKKGLDVFTRELYNVTMCICNHITHIDNQVQQPPNHFPFTPTQALEMRIIELPLINDFWWSQQTSPFQRMPGMVCWIHWFSPSFHPSHAFDTQGSQCLDDIHRQGTYQATGIGRKGVEGIRRLLVVWGLPTGGNWSEQTRWWDHWPLYLGMNFYQCWRHNLSVRRD